MPLFDTYHAYVFGTAFWYSLRAFMRIVSPTTVISWFRPPIDRLLPANDLELYTTWTDGFGLLALATILVVLSDAVPLPGSLVGSALAERATERAKKPYARAAILITMFHHITTGIGAYQHWIRPTHHTIAMDIGVYGNIGLTVLGAVALYYGLADEAPKHKTRKAH